MTKINPNWAVRYFTLWAGQALSLLGSQLVQFAIIWYLTQETNSATTLAVASMRGLLPQVLLSPFIGTWVDRGNRRLILIAADGTVAVATFVLAVLFTFGFVNVVHIYITLFIRAVAGGFHQSAFGACTGIQSSSIWWTQHHLCTAWCVTHFHYAHAGNPRHRRGDGFAGDRNPPLHSDSPA